MTVRLVLWQRLSALVMAPLVIVHLIIMIYAMRQGLSAEAILGRTQGSVVWMVVYGSFVVAVSIHGAIGLRTVMEEWMNIRGALLEWLMWGIGFSLLLLGARAVYGVTA